MKFGIASIVLCVWTCTAPCNAAPTVYVSSLYGGTISKISPTGQVTPFISGLTTPTGLAFNSAGTLFVAEPGAQSIVQISPPGVVSPFISNFPDAHGFAFGTDGNLYVASGTQHSVTRITPSGDQSIVASGLNFPQGLVLDSADNIYYNDMNGTLNKITQAGVVTTIATGLVQSTGLVLAPNGNFYTGSGDYFNSPGAANTIVQITPAGVVSTLPTTGDPLVTPFGLVADIDGTLLVTNFNSDTVSTVSPGGLITTLASGFDHPYGVAIAVPEPTSLGLAAVAGLALLRRTRRA